ncbi:MAG: hypothetical protein Q9159_002275 [Coniocarpon cinnabarinum]
MSAAIHGLTTQQQVFLQPTRALNSSVLDLGKQFFDALAHDISSAQDVRRKNERQARKRKRAEYEEPGGILRMQQLCVDGFEVEQVWQQAKRVLDATLDEVQRDAAAMEEAMDGHSDDAEEDGRVSKVARREDDGLVEEDSDELGSLGEEGVDWEYEGEDMDVQQSEKLRSEQDQVVESEDSEVDLSDTGQETPLSGVSDGEELTDELVKDRHGLNDGFFSIDQFNKHSQAMETVDARGDEDDGAASDEEDIDWAADPLTSGATLNFNRVQKPHKKNKQDTLEEGESSAAEDGPTFGDVDLDAPDSEDDEDVGGIPLTNDDAMGDFSNTNDIMYNDFFAPPAKAKSRAAPKPKRDSANKVPVSEKRRAATELATEDGAGRSDDGADMKRAISSVRKDLEDDETDLDDDEEGEEDQLDPRSQNLSTHERRMAEFQREIARLERENVANKPWALTGETVAPARPENALLEEDLDFERAGKPLPVITQEVNESIEALIKRRILNNEFDEVRRRRPELEGVDGSVRRGMLDANGRRGELSDTKPQRGLADEYEDEYLRKTDPNYVDKRSEVTKKKHAEIEKQWAEIRSQLDALCNWHYKPRPPEKNLEVRTDTATVQMEDARPAAEAGANASGLAPQEVYRPGQDGKAAGEIRTKGGTAISKEEESRESKRRRRRRNKEKALKSRGNGTNAQRDDRQAANDNRNQSKKSGDRREVVDTLKKGNVKVIGKKGELQDVEGKVSSTNAHGGKAGVAGFVL